MIPRGMVAASLGLSETTDALPPGDLPLDRFSARLIGYLSTPDANVDTPDAWTGAVMDALIADDPDLALAAIRAGAGLPGAGVLADPLAELGASDPVMRDRIETLAGDDADLGALVSAIEG